MSQITSRDRFRGCLMGLAAGDALGTTLEFKSPGTFQQACPTRSTCSREMTSWMGFRGR